jgi:hypothetical protein
MLQFSEWETMLTFAAYIHSYSGTIAKLPSFWSLTACLPSFFSFLHSCPGLFFNMNAKVTPTLSNTVRSHDWKGYCTLGSWVYSIEKSIQRITTLFLLADPRRPSLKKMASSTAGGRVAHQRSPPRSHLEPPPVLLTSCRSRAASHGHRSYSPSATGEWVAEHPHRVDKLNVPQAEQLIGAERRHLGAAHERSGAPGEDAGGEYVKGRDGRKMSARTPTAIRQPWRPGPASAFRHWGYAPPTLEAAAPC